MKLSALLLSIGGISSLSPALGQQHEGANKDPAVPLDAINPSNYLGEPVAMYDSPVYLKSRMYFFFFIIITK